MSLLLIATGTAAVERNLTTADIEQALAIARSREVERAAFHAPYITRVKHPVVESIEVITEYRRVVLTAEDRIRRGERMFAYSSRLAADAIAPWRDRVSVIARLRFHPQNNYIGVPAIDISVDGPAADRAFIGIRSDPVLSLPAPNPIEGQPVLGAVADAIFDSTIVGQSRRTVTIRLDKKELTRMAIDFTALK